MSVSIDQIAKVCHEANRAYAQEMGDMSHAPWSELTPAQKNGAIAGVEFARNNREVSAAEMHAEWLKVKEADGWKYGAQKNEETKEHPSMLPYDQLPLSERLKDYLFKAIVHALSD